MNKKIVVIILVAAAALVSFALPGPKNIPENAFKQMDIPHRFSRWVGKSSGDPLSREYARADGRRLLFIVLGAGNFHHPRVCYAAAGYRFDEVNGLKFGLPGRELKPSALLMKKGNEEFLIIYWLSIDKKITGWTGQKLFEFRRVVLGSNKVGLMMRVDVPVYGSDIDGALHLAQDFLSSLASSIPPSTAEYIFGKK